jgi:molybdopterin-binding protein
MPEDRLDPLFRIYAELAARRSLARVTPDEAESLGLAVGREVVALVKSVSIDMLPG